jgi:sulfite exporter TauE/SafE
MCGLGPDAGPALPLAAALFVMGLMGGMAHCTVMCGPFVLAQVGERFAAGARSRAWTAVLAPYQLGRISTYAGLGAVAGGLGATAAWAGEWRWIPAAALLLAALVFALQALGRMRLGWGEAVAARLSFGRLRGFGLGLALGFLPCGLIYGALIASAGAGGAWQGALAMAAFGLGTVPALAIVAWLGLTAGRRWLDLARRSAPVIGLVSATILAVLAIRAL